MAPAIQGLGECVLLGAHYNPDSLRILLQSLTPNPKMHTMEMNWKKGDLLFIRAHTFVGGKGLSYEAGVYEAAEDGFSGGWDVFDSTIDISFYGFSVEKVQHKEEERMMVYLLWRDRENGCTLVGIYQTRELANQECERKARQWAELNPLRTRELNPFWIEEYKVQQ